MPAAASPIAAIVAHAEAEAAAAIAAATGTKKLAPAPAAEPARPRTRTATISVPPPLPTPARAARASVPPPLSSTIVTRLEPAQATMAAAPPPPRAPSPNIVIADELASADPLFAPAEPSLTPAADEMFAATAPALPAPALPALPRPSQNWMRATTSAHAQAHAELPLAAQDRRPVRRARADRRRG